MFEVVESTYKSYSLYIKDNEEKGKQAVIISPRQKATMNKNNSWDQLNDFIPVRDFNTKEEAEIYAEEYYQAYFKSCSLCGCFCEVESMKGQKFKYDGRPELLNGFFCESCVDGASNIKWF